MSSDLVFTAVQNFLYANFTTVPLNFENDQFVLPDPPSPWVDVEIYGSSFNQSSFGSGVPSTDNWTEMGAVLCHVMIPVNTGSLLGRQIATQLSTLFKGRRIEPDIRFGDQSIGAGMVQIETGNWWPISLRIEWQRDLPV